MLVNALLMAKMSWCLSYGLCLIGVMAKPNRKWCIHLSGSRLSPRTKNPEVSFSLNLKYILNTYFASMQSSFSHSIPGEEKKQNILL